MNYMIDWLDRVDELYGLWFSDKAPTSNKTNKMNLNTAGIVFVHIGFVNQYNNNNSCVIFDDLSSKIKQGSMYLINMLEVGMLISTIYI